MKFLLALVSLVHGTSAFQQRIAHSHSHLHSYAYRRTGRNAGSRSPQRRLRSDFDWHLHQSSVNVQTISTTAAAAAATATTTAPVPKDRVKRRTNIQVRDGSAIENNRLSRTIECGQKQLPLHKRLAKASLEEIVPWLLTTILAIVPSILFDTPDVPYYVLGAEAAFGMFGTWKLLHKLNIPKMPEPLIGPRTWEDVARNLWASHDDVESRREALMGWFYDAPYEKMRHEDALSYVAWTRFGVPLGTGTLTEEEIGELFQFDLPLLLQNVNHGHPLPKRGVHEDPLPMMSFNCEPLRYRHKPLLFYAVTHGISYLAHRALTKSGFQYVAAKDPEHDLSYWYYLPSGKSDNINANINADPLVFIHGVGGISSCYQMIEEMKQATEHDNVPIVCIDLPHVSLKWTGDTPTIESQVASISKILDDIPFKKGGDTSPTKATFVGHSFGTAVVSWMLQSHPDKVNGCVFIDPICFQLHLKKILFNFHMQRVDFEIQSTQQWANPFNVESLINLAGTEMHTNYSMLRQFSWATNSLWPEDLEDLNVPSLVILSEDDEIVPVQDIERLLSRSQSPLLTTHTFERANHGEMMFDETLRSLTVGKILDVMRTAKSDRQSSSSQPKNLNQSPWTTGFRRVMYASD